MSDHGAVYEFEPGERVTLYSRLHPTAVPAIVLHRLERSGAYAVLVADGGGRIFESVADASEMGLRHEYLALDRLVEMIRSDCHGPDWTTRDGEYLR